jgi:hypothetical protein
LSRREPDLQCGVQVSHFSIPQIAATMGLLTVQPRSHTVGVKLRRFIFKVCAASQHN